jgi:tetratricopeptide (TPR) repeat protein
MNVARTHLVMIAALALVSSGFAIAASSAEIDVRLSGQETYVGLPVILQVRISNASKHEEPEMPQVDGLSIESTGTPASSSQISIINGRRSERSSVTYSYRITPRREGEFTIPPLIVKADGAQELTRAQRIAVTKSETGDLMFVEIEGKKDSIYVGQPLELTLKIWLRPYRDQERQIVLSEGDMWNLIASETSWGLFAERMQEIDEGNQRPGGEEVLREDSAGQSRSYYLYEVVATIYPQRAGKIDAKDVQIVMRYPTALGQSRSRMSSMFGDDPLSFRSRMFEDDFFASPFGRNRLSVTAVRPIVADAVVQPIRVKPIPTVGRPADYRGAVGQYKIVTEARPTRVKAGDPITLHVGIAGNGPMDLVQAPPLADLPSLTQSFRVPNEPLAGFVDGSQKVFSTSIRPVSEAVTEIPAIPLSYFDPDAEKFVTVYSDPIKIEVEHADTLALGAIVGGGRGARAEGDAESASESPLSAVSFENYSGDDVLQNEPPAASLTFLHWLGLVIPPLLVVGLLMVRTGQRLGMLTSSFRSPIRQLQSSIAHAENAREVGLAITAYLQRRLRNRTAEPDSSAAIGALRTAGHRDLAVRFERLLGENDPPAGPIDRQRLGELKLATLAATEELEQRSQIWRRRPVVQSNGKRATTQASALFALGLLFATQGTVGYAAEFSGRPQYSELQKEVLLAEATQLYSQAIATSDNAPADSKQLASRAAEKYQLLVDDGLRNSKLYFNLANAYHHSGRVGPAIANYRRALRIDPTNHIFHANLEQVEATAGVKPEVGTSTRSLSDRLDRLNDVISRHVHPRTVGVAALLLWFCAWTCIALRLLRVQFPWKTLTAASLMLFVTTAVSYGNSVETFRRQDTGILVEPQLALRSGDGTNFSSTANWEQCEGQSVMVLHRRGDWLQVRGNGQTGWVPADAVEVLGS